MRWSVRQLLALLRPNPEASWHVVGSGDYNNGVFDSETGQDITRVLSA